MPRTEPSRSDIAKAVLKMAEQNPEMGQFSVAEVLTKHGLKISPSGVRGIWKRHNLETTYQRLLAKSASSGRAHVSNLSESQLDLLRREQVSERLRQRAEKGAASLTEIRREELLHAAVRVFSRKGFASASLKEICAAAGIQSNSLYYHFKSKEELFAAVHELGMKRTTGAIRESISGLEAPIDRLEQACATAVRFILDRSAYAVIARVDLTVRVTASLQRRLNADRAEFEEIFRSLIDAVPLSPETDRSLLRLALIGAMNWTNAWYKPGRLSPEEIGRGLVRNLLLHQPGARQPAGLRKQQEDLSGVRRR